MPVTDEETVRLLLSVMKSLENGKPNWKTVAEELKLPTPGAAAKRFSRLLAAAGITSPFGGGVGSGGGATKRKGSPADGEGETNAEERTPSPKKTSPKKSKVVTPKKVKKQAVEDEDENEG